MTVLFRVPKIRSYERYGLMAIRAYGFMARPTCIKDETISFTYQDNIIKCREGRIIFVEERNSDILEKFSHVDDRCNFRDRFNLLEPAILRHLYPHLFSSGEIRIVEKEAKDLNPDQWSSWDKYQKLLTSRKIKLEILHLTPQNNMDIGFKTRMGPVGPRLIPNPEYSKPTDEPSRLILPLPQMIKPALFEGNLSENQSNLRALGEDITCTPQLWELLSKDDKCAYLLMNSIKGSNTLGHFDALISSFPQNTCRLDITKTRRGQI